MLAESGHIDVAYELLYQDTEPSWRVMVERGATTVWEEWGGVAADGTPSGSLNHYSKGAVISFLHRFVAGLHLVEPGWRRVRVAPRPGGAITSAATHHDAPTGRIDVRWGIEDGRGELVLDLPPGTAADLDLPDGSSETVGAGSYRRTWTANAAHPGSTDA